MDQLKTYVVDKSGREWFISTVQLMFPGPLPFETMVFSAKNCEVINGADADWEQYETEAEAIEGHQIMVDRVKGWKK